MGTHLEVSKINVLCVNSYYKPAYCYGGPVRSISAMLEGLVGVGADVTAFTTNANCGDKLDVPLSTPIDVGGVTVYYYPLTFSKPFMFSGEMDRELKHRVKDFDIVICNSIWGFDLKRVSEKSLETGVPFIVSPRGQLLPWALKHKRWKKYTFWNLFAKRYLSCASAIHCTSQKEADAIKKLSLGVPIFVIPNSLDLERFRNLPAKGEMRKEFGISENASMILAVGRLHKVKNPCLLISSLAGLDRSDVHLLFIGPDEEGMKPNLKNLASQLNVSDRVHFGGLRTGQSLLQAYVDSDLLVMPSAMESFGMAAVEALAAGVPVLTSEQVPVGQWAESAGVGKVCKCSSENFTREIRHLLESPEELNSMARKARRMVEQDFSKSKVAERMLTKLEIIASRSTQIK